MRHYIAGVIVTGLDFLCHLFNHAGGCALSGNGPSWLRRVYYWAWEIVNPETVPNRQPFCQRDVLWGALEPGTITTYSTAGSTTVWYRYPDPRVPDA